VKVSLLKDIPAFEQVCELAPRIRQRDWSAAAPVIRRSAQLHIDHITQGGDPFESLEARPLDFGHWSAHKLEVLTDYRLRHGEAVGIGVAIDTVYSSLKHGLPVDAANRAIDCLAELGLPLNDPSLADPQPLFDGLEEFRQHLGGRLTVTMLEAVGRKIDVHDIDRSAMREAIAAVRERGANQRTAASSRSTTTP
jgi:3-dehydroquinate synthase